MMKKTMTMMLTAAMILSMGLTVGAASPKYSIHVDDDELKMKQDNKVVTYQLEDSRITLSKNKEDGITVSFVEEDEGVRKISLGTQKTVTVYGELDELSISKTLDKDYTVTIDEKANVDQIFSGGNAKISVDGEVDDVYLVSAGARLVENSTGEIDTVYAKNENSVKGVLSHRVKPYKDAPRVESVYDYDYDDDDDDRDYHHRYDEDDLGISRVRDNGRTISFYCEVSGATVRWNGSKIGTTDRGSNSFNVGSSRYWDDKLTISKDGYETEVYYMGDADDGDYHYGNNVHYHRY